MKCDVDFLIAAGALQTPRIVSAVVGSAQYNTAVHFSDDEHNFRCIVRLLISGMMSQLKVWTEQSLGGP
jgi:hypothetical protein